MPSLLATQTHPNHWPNPLAWKPSRWIIPSTPTSGPLRSLDPTPPGCQETLLTPAQSTYFPWSDGLQNCPGAKFAQVEFVAVLACLLREHRIEVASEPREGFGKARERVLATTEDCDLELLLRMRNPEKVRLACRRM